MTTMVATKELMPTDTRGKRIKAQIANTGESVTLGWDYSLQVRHNHLKAAKLLVQKTIPVKRSTTASAGTDLTFATAWQKAGVYVHVLCAEAPGFDPVVWKVSVRVVSEAKA